MPQPQVSIRQNGSKTGSRFTCLRKRKPGRRKIHLHRQDKRVNLNSASREELMTLTGIGEAKASDIISYREENGGFEKPEDIMKIRGIKQGIYRKIKDMITV